MAAPRASTPTNAGRALLLLAALLAASSCCSASRLLQQDTSSDNTTTTANMTTMTANMILPRVNATITSITPNTSGSTSATNATTLSAIRLRKCAWDEPSRSCRLDASYSLSPEVPEPSEYGAWVLTGSAALDMLCGAHTTVRACNADFANQCAWDGSARACTFGASNDYTLAQLFLCQGSQGAQAIQCSLYNSSACALNPNCSYVDLGGGGPETDSETADGSTMACVVAEVAGLGQDELRNWYDDFSHFRPSVWGSCEQVRYAKDLLGCALYGSETDCAADSGCAWDADFEQCSLTSEALYGVLVSGDTEFGRAFDAASGSCRALGSRQECEGDSFSVDRARLDNGRTAMLAAVGPSGNVTQLFNSTSS